MHGVDNRCHHKEVDPTVQQGMHPCPDEERQVDEEPHVAFSFSPSMDNHQNRATKLAVESNSPCDQA